MNRLGRSVQEDMDNTRDAKVASFEDLITDGFVLIEIESVAWFNITSILEGITYGLKDALKE